MNSKILGIFFLVIGFNAYCQNFKSLEEIVPDSSNYQNIYVKKIDSDSLVSNFIIWIKDEVKAHKHVTHCETIIVLEGVATMTLGAEKIEIKKGDYIFIPKNTPHSVKVISQYPLKVISIQAPEFNGSDRVFMKE